LRLFPASLLEGGHRLTGVIGVGADIDILGLQLGVDDGLAGVQPIVAGEHVADAADQGKIQQPTIPEQLHGQEDGGQRAVGGPAEHSGQPQRRGEASRNPQQRPRHTAEGGPHEEGGHHLTALEPCGER
ncbi:HK97 gp10 family phage protein, partial [Dysosmobacter welbionis]